MIDPSKQRVEFLKKHGDWLPGERADFSRATAEILVKMGVAVVLCSAVRQKARKRSDDKWQP